MQTGSRLAVRHTLPQLRMDQSYYLVRNCRVRQRVLLVDFGERSSPRANLTIIPRAEFERWITLGSLEADVAKSSLPPWLHRLEGRCLDLVDESRTRPAITHSDRTDKRLLQIEPLLRREHEILQADCPVVAINNYCNEQKLTHWRIRLWFFTYLCFGRTKWCLLPSFHNAGHWDRYLTTSALGRRDADGSRTRIIDTQLEQKIITAYQRHSSLTKTLSAIYAEAMVFSLGYRVEADQHGTEHFVHPDGWDQITYSQFTYRLKKSLGKPYIEERRVGKSKFRRAKAEQAGSFSESLTNLMERAECDSRHVKDVPRYEGDKAVSNIYVTTAVCSTSGMTVGMGFSFGAENSDAYKGMLFSMALPKKEFCSLFGVPIRDEEWPSIGLPLRLILDRGPGRVLVQTKLSDPTDVISGVEFTPSGQGQSKPYVESSHPRRLSHEEGPSHVVGDASAMDLVKRAIIDVLARNATSDVKTRITPEMRRHKVEPVPNGVWNFLNRLGRNDALDISRDDAVRRYLKKITLRVERNGVFYHDQRYDSLELRKTGVIERRASSYAMSVTGYLLPMCVRFIWIEVDGKILKLGASSKMFHYDEQLDRSESDLIAEDNTRIEAERKLRKKKKVVAANALLRSAELTGVKTKGVVRFGKIKVDKETSRGLKKIFHGVQKRG